MQNNDPILFVRNIEQAALWLELDGQISDGMWENARPYDHWKVWCNATVRVAKGAQSAGRSFYAVKDTYNFTNKELLDVVALRMLSIVRIARSFGIEVASILEHAPETETGNIRWDQPWMTKYIERIQALGVEPEMVNAAIAGDTYDRKDMMKDLRDLKVIIKQRVEAQ